MKIKHLLRYPFDIRIARRHLSNGSTERNRCTGQTIGLDLYSDKLLLDCGRHFACLAASANRADLRIVLRCTRLLLSAIAHKPLGRKFLSMANVRWVETGQPIVDALLVLTDVEPLPGTRPLDNQRLVTMMIGRDVVQGTPVMPYPMHPDQIEELSDVRLHRYRETPKTGVFFAGNQKPRYGRDHIQSDFGVLSRLDVIETLRSFFPERIEPRESGGDRTRIVIRNSHLDPIEPHDWLSVLSKHEFFLCAPGVSQPMCHNVIEAMSVGAIPILEYGNRFHPELTDGSNAICFRGRLGLVEAIARIDAMSRPERERMRENVCRYFDHHLRGDRFLSTLAETAATEWIDRISMPFHDKNLFDSDRHSCGSELPQRKQAA